jgi:cytochrome c biogenesis protein
VTVQDDAAAVELTTQPAPVQPPGNDWLGPLRYGWRQLTSMRTALLLLFLLALAAVPGGFLPQRKINPLRVNQYIDEHPKLGPVLDRLSMFDVFSSTWFAAIYLLLFVSLIGCLVPRTRLHLRALRSRPPKVPRSLGRLPVSDRWETTDDADAVLGRAESVLRGWRTVRREAELSAERGYLRETGNLVFHLSLVLLLIGIAVGAFRGFKGTVLVVEGKGFSNTIALYDDIQPGRSFQAGSLVPFSFTLKDFRATYTTEGKALTFNALVDWSRPGGKAQRYDVRVNHPLVVDGAKTYLIGHGYAPRVVVRDSDGQVIDDRFVPCLPQNPEFLSTCVVKEPFTKGEQVGFTGVFTPTTVTDKEGRIGSASPALVNPVLTLTAFEGDLGLDSGIPQSVYSLDTSRMRTADGGKPHALLPGQVLTLPSGMTLTYAGNAEWATFQVTQDPGKLIALAAAIGIVGGLLLSLLVRRRRVWVRALEGPDGTTTVEAGGLARTDADRFAAEFAELTARMRSTGA